MANILDSYLVELGVSVKPQDINMWDNALGTLGKKFDIAAKKHENWILSLAGGSTNIMRSAARADMAMQKLSVRLYTTVEGARQFSRAMSAMGLQGLEDLKDVANNPELTAYYHDLMDLAWETDVLQNQTYQNMMKRIRSYEHEFDRLKIMGLSLRDSLAVAIFKMSSPRLEKFIKDMKNLEGFLLGPSGSKAINRVGSFLGETLNDVLRLGDAIVDLGKNGAHAYKGLKQIWDALPSQAKEFSKLGAFGILAKRSPAAAGFVAASDYARYREEDKLGQVDMTKLNNKIWSYIDKFFGQYRENFDPAVETLSTATLDDWVQSWNEFNQQVDEGIRNLENQYAPIILQELKKLWDSIVNSLREGFSDLGDAWFSIADFLEPIGESIEANIKILLDAILAPIQVLSGFYGGIKQIITGELSLKDFLKFNWFNIKDAFSNMGGQDVGGAFKDMFTGIKNWSSGETSSSTSSVVSSGNSTPISWSNGVPMNNTFTFNISGANSPEVVATIVKQSVGDALMPIATGNRKGLVH